MYYYPDIFGLGAPEVISLIIWGLGVTCVIVAAALRRLTVRETIVALVVAVFIPVLGAIAAIVFVTARWRRHGGQMPGRTTATH